MSSLRCIRSAVVSSSRALAARRSLSTAMTARTAFPSTIRSAVGASRAFSVSTRRFGQGASDVALTEKLNKELEYEKNEDPTQGAVPDFLKSFNAQGVWTIEDTPGNDEVTLRRKFGNEDVRVIFSIADIAAEQEGPEFDEEGSEESDPENPTFPIRVSLSITKSNAEGSINIDTLCQEGGFVIENISYYKDAKVGTSLTAVADWTRRGLYIGPQFDTLDISLQDEFEKYLAERGIGESLALFIPEYAEHKEQKEYVKWLDNVKAFVEA